VWTCLFGRVATEEMELFLVLCNFMGKTLIKTDWDFNFQLALRAGHEKDEETADTVGCCSLRFEHISKYKVVQNIL